MVVMCSTVIASALLSGRPRTGQVKITQLGAAGMNRIMAPTGNAKHAAPVPVMSTSANIVVFLKKNLAKGCTFTTSYP
jgi:hypothetical protein